MELRKTLLLFVFLNIMGNAICFADIWENDFEDGQLDKWIIEGFPPRALLPPGLICKIENGELIINSTDPPCGVILIANMPIWSDYIVQCEISEPKIFGRDSEIKILFRYTSEIATGYGYGYQGVLGGMLGFWKYNENRIVNIASVGLMPPPSGTWQIEAKGENLKFLLNGNLVNPLSDQVKDNTFSEGKVAILVFAASVSIDDFLVETISSNSIDPQNKLIATWGRLKFHLSESKIFFGDTGEVPFLMKEVTDAKANRYKENFDNRFGTYCDRASL